MIIIHDQKTLLLNFKSSFSQMFFKIGTLANFTIFTGKYVWCIYQKENPNQVFSCKYCKTFKNIYFEEHLGTAVSVLIKKESN